MGLPQTNAQLTGVATDGPTDDWDVAEDSGPFIWQGNTDAYVIEKVNTNFMQTEGALKKSKDLQLILDQAFAVAVGINSGHILVFNWRGQQHVRRVIEYNGATLAGVPNYMRFHLRPEPVEINLEGF